MAYWTVYRRHKDILTFLTESIEIVGALLATFFVIIKICIEDDRAVINCFRAREKVGTDMRLTYLLGEDYIQDLKALYAGKAKGTRQIFRKRNYSLCLHPATDEGIASDSKLSLKHLRRWKYSIFGNIIVTPDNRVGVLDACNHEDNPRNNPEYYVSYKLDLMSSRVLRDILHEGIILR